MATLKKKKTLADKAKENTTVVKKSSGNEETLTKGIPLDHTSKHNPKSPCIIGMSKGVTKNMDNYESLRVDVWLSDSVQEGETKKEALERIESFVDTALEEAVFNTIGE